MEKSIAERHRSISPEMNATLAEPITMDEMWKAISQGRPNKAAGVDGKSL
jgi:hypothetical protein